MFMTALYVLYYLCLEKFFFPFKDITIKCYQTDLILCIKWGKSTVNISTKCICNWNVIYCLSCGPKRTGKPSSSLLDLVALIFLRETGCRVDDLWGADGGAFWVKLPPSRTLFRHSKLLRAVSLELGCLFQHVVMTCCQIPHGRSVSLIWVDRRSRFVTSSRSLCSDLLVRAASNAVSPYHSSQRAYPKLYISALLL